jgi:hypothetical protein
MNPSIALSKDYGRRMSDFGVHTRNGLILAKYNLRASFHIR